MKNFNLSLDHITLSIVLVGKTHDNGYIVISNHEELLCNYYDNIKNPYYRLIYFIDRKNYYIFNITRKCLHSKKNSRKYLKAQITKARKSMGTQNE